MYVHTFFQRNKVGVVARLAARDIRSNLGSNVDLLRRETGLDPGTAGKSQVCRVLKEKNMVNVPEEEGWRVPYLQKFLSERLMAHYTKYVQGEKRLQGLVDSLVVN